ncbi:MAG: cob(I)yrinic acid a,c-diamide adenosyltransferase [Paludibacteraceae bacterium]|nr:cob(I)yrinic acid a,c-diamide adenosyltransferase [Paludibacteraceae bacterium]
MKIYTKRGDKGETDLIGGTRAAKDDVRLEAYGTADELNAFVGLLRAQPIGKQIDEQLEDVQNQLFNIGAYLATDQNKTQPFVHITNEKTEELEQYIDDMEQTIPPLHQFILPTGNQTIALCHVCRTITRRLERNITAMSREYNIEDELLKYVNRLSDYFFVLAKKITIIDKINFFFWKK